MRDRPPVSADTGQRLVHVVFVLWIGAFLIKHAGASWDIAWHFRYPFGTFEPPHLVNIAGSALAAALLVWQVMTGKATERLSLLVIQGGFVVFLLSALLDILNHYLFGLDVTVWSPTHVLTFASTTVVLAGVIFAALRLTTSPRWRLGLGLALWVFLLDDALFQLSQQEYGVIAIADYLRGQTSASPELLVLAGRDPVAFAEGGIPHWVYPLWLIGTSTLGLVAAHRVLAWRWSATAVALLYLAYRAVGFELLIAFDFPRSFIPVMLLGAAFLIDVAEQRRWSPLVISVALVVVYYVGAFVIGQNMLMPGFAFSTAPAALAMLWGGFLAARWWSQWRNRKVALPAM